MGVSNSAVVLDREQLRDITFDDQALMREILAALIDDTSRQMQLLESAIGEGNADQCKRLAHYSKGACANVGANAAAEVLRQLERSAAGGEFYECSRALALLSQEINRLRAETSAI